MSEKGIPGLPNRLSRRQWAAVLIGSVTFLAMAYESGEQTGFQKTVEASVPFEPSGQNSLVDVYNMPSITDQSYVVARINRFFDIKCRTVSSTLADRPTTESVYKVSFRSDDGEAVSGYVLDEQALVDSGLINNCD